MGLRIKTVIFITKSGVEPQSSIVGIHVHESKDKNSHIYNKVRS